MERSINISSDSSGYLSFKLPAATNTDFTARIPEHIPKPLIIKPAWMEFRHKEGHMSCYHNHNGTEMKAVLSTIYK